MKKNVQKKNLLLTGATGFLGWNICLQAPEEWSIFGTVFSHSSPLRNTQTIRADLRDFKNLRLIFNRIKPQAVIHTAAVTDPNYCQLHPQETRQINLEVSLNLAGLCADHQIPLAFTSSDLVFDGRHPPYAETDPVSPVNFYGEQKALAEEGMRMRWPETIICRLPLMFGEAGSAAQSFLQPMLKAIREDGTLNLFVDEFRTPISGRTAAAGLFLALEKTGGIIHLGGRESISRYDFGLLLKDLLGTDKGKIIPCRQADVKMPAPRPPDVSLNSSKAFALGFDPPSLKKDLEKCFYGMKES